MNLFRYFRPITSAPVARKRLETLLAYDRCSLARLDFGTLSREDVVALLSRYVEVPPNHVRLTVNHGSDLSRLTIDVEIPHLIGVTVAGRA
jgi:cell division topological specificity factor